MRKGSMLLVAAAVALAACGDDEGSAGPAPQTKDDGAATTETAPAKKTGPARERNTGTTVTLGDSEFGSMLFGPKRQAIYIFEQDPKGKTVCYGECAAAWPPVFTKGEPRAGKGVKQSLLGTVKRRDGRVQVSYAGKPLYYYAHEGPGEVRCHNVNLNGGFWWVVGPDGARRA